MLPRLLAECRRLGERHGWQMKQNVSTFSNNGFYTVPEGDRDDAPTVYPTEFEAWLALFESRKLATVRIEPATTYGTPTIWRDACKTIADYPVSGNSEPELMATAIDAMQRLARLAAYGPEDDDDSDLERCDSCGDPLQPSQIGLCDACQEE